MAITDQQYYSDSSNWGGEQYVKLSDVINNFMLINVGDNKLVNDINRYDVIFHAKRGLQELHYDSLKEVRVVEMEMPETLQIVLPKDYVSLVKISWVDSKGRLHPMTTGNQTTVVDKAFLQDDQGNILFSGSPEESALEGTPLMDIRNMQVAESQDSSNDPLNDFIQGGRFGMDTANANINGTYNVSKHLGVVRFSSDVYGKLIVIEYLTDGMADTADSDLKVHKFAEDFLYKYILYEIVRNKFGIQEYIVTRAKRDYFAALKNTKIRMMDVHPLDILQSLKGRNKWIR